MSTSTVSVDTAATLGLRFGGLPGGRCRPTPDH